MTEVTRITLLLGMTLRTGATQAVHVSKFFLPEDNLVSVRNRRVAIRAVLKKGQMIFMWKFKEFGFATLGDIAVALEANPVGDYGLRFRIGAAQMQVYLP